MDNDSSEKMDLEIAIAISDLEAAIERKLTDQERAMVRIGFLKGNGYGLQEAKLLIES